MSNIRIATRREFLLQGLGLVGVGASLPNFLVQTALAGPKAQKGDSILVVLQLSGGHDGLSAVVPYNNDDYGRNRRATRIAANEVIKINDQVGMHPNLKELKGLFDAGSFGIVQGVGYPNPNRSHFKSMDIWHLADNSGRAISYGWLGRYCDIAHKGVNDPKLAVAVGSDRAPLAIQGKEHAGISLQQPEAFRYIASSSGKLAGTYRKLNEMTAEAGGPNSSLEFVSRTAVDANTASDEILKLARQYTSKTTYPNSRLAASLKTVGSLIAGGLSTRVYYVFQGGFDTHAGQRGRHDRLMTELSEGMAAFQKDLADQGNANRVVTIAFSEFGRRLKENFSQGTDHGVAGPMFLFGPKIKPGLHGKYPSLAEGDLTNGDLRHTVDFRSVYATMLEKWLGTRSEPILGGKFPLIDCLA
jgi:uncharacterized protein (DUF1501 family)